MPAVPGYIRSLQICTPDRHPEEYEHCKSQPCQAPGAAAAVSVQFFAPDDRDDDIVSVRIARKAQNETALGEGTGSDVLYVPESGPVP